MIDNSGRRRPGSADRLAVSPSFGDREHLLVLLDASAIAFRNSAARPPDFAHASWRVSGVQRQLDIAGLSAEPR